MRTNSKQTNGFTIVEIVLIIAVLGLLGYIGYTAWQTASKKTDSQTTQTTGQKEEKKTIADPYAGWKEYCSAAGGYCVKYPTDWVLSEEGTPDPAINAARFTPPAGDFTIQYNPFLDGIGGMAEPGTSLFTTLSVEKTPEVGGKNVVRGIHEDKSPGYEHFKPQVFVASDEDIATYKLHVGETTDVGFFVPRLAVSQVLSIQHGNKFTSRDEAKKWLNNTQNIDTAELILKSVSKTD